MCDAGGLLGKIISSSQISAEDPYFAVDVARQQQSAALIRKFAMDADRRGPGDRGYLALHFAPFREAAHRAV